MLFGARGGAKTFTTLGLALGIAGGFSILNWRVPKPRKVLYVDAEMDPAEVQARLRKLLAGMPFPACALENLFILGHYDFPNGIPDISVQGSTGRAVIERNAADCELVILDNLSALMSSGNENEAESWNTMGQWLLRFRKRGQTVLLIHHAGKGDDADQRGTSRREDLMNSVVKLQKVSAKPGEPIFTKWTFTKARSFQPEDPFEFELRFADGDRAASLHRCADPNQEVQELLAQGDSLAKIAAKTGVSKTTVWRRAQRVSPVPLSKTPQS